MPPGASAVLRGRGRCTLALRFVLTAAMLCGGHLVHAQELNPRAYVITPVGTNVINLGYSHLEGNPDFAGAAPITDAHGRVDLTALGYYRSFGFLGRSANFALGIPYAVAELSGNVSDVPKIGRASCRE